MRSQCVAMVLAASSLVGSVQATPQGCPTPNHWVYFSHDTYGYGTPQGPSNPCQAMKAITEGALAPVDPSKTSYFGARLSRNPQYAMDPIMYAGTVTVLYDYVQNTGENHATEGEDYDTWYLDCGGVIRPSATHFEIPAKPCNDPQACAGAGIPFITTVDQDDSWEPPELARMKLMSSSTSAGGTSAIAIENLIASWVIQDECESGALFKYPDPLPAPSSQYGLTVQLATSLEGYTPDFNRVDFESHVAQNYPYAASEVVAETSWLEFTLALMSENSYRERMGNMTFGIGGDLVAAPAPIEVSYRLLGYADWSPPAECSATPAAWNHYADQGLDPMDFVIERYDPNAPPPFWVRVDPAMTPPYESTVTIPFGETHLKLRFKAENNNGPGTPIEVAHLHITEVRFPAPPPYDPTLRVGWSSDFRFLIQENTQCPE